MLPYITLLGFHVQTYYVCAALAGAAAMGLAYSNLRKARLGGWRYLLPLLLAPSALVGARLLNYVLNPSAYGQEFRPWALSYRNLSLMGGLVAGVGALVLFAFCKRQSPWPLLDAMVLPGGAAIVLLKVGCFLNGCCIGRPTGGAFGMRFPANEVIYDYLDTLPLLQAQNRTVHPTQLYEFSGAALGLCAILPLMRRRRLPRGVGALLYALWFTIVRLAVHPLRAFPYARFITVTVYPVFYFSILILLSVVLTVIMRRQGQRRAGAPSDKGR